MRPMKKTDAHKTDSLAELVCSNSFRSDDAKANAVGLLHAELRKLNSLIMAAADKNQVPAGGALAVDRDGFAAAVTEAIHKDPLITIERGEVDTLPPQEWDNVIIATGPLTSPALAEAILSLTGEKQFVFFLMRSRPSFTKRQSISILHGIKVAMIKSAPVEQAPITSIVRSTVITISHLSKP